MQQIVFKEHPKVHVLQRLAHTIFAVEVAGGHGEGHVVLLLFWMVYIG